MAKTATHYRWDDLVLSREGPIVWGKAQYEKTWAAMLESLEKAVGD